jgi:hypothetical protein
VDEKAYPASPFASEYPYGPGKAARDELAAKNPGYFAAIHDAEPMLLGEAVSPLQPLVDLIKAMVPGTKISIEIEHPPST